MRKLLFLFVALLATTSLWAYDFQHGDLYYNITSNSKPYTVEVTYQLIPRSLPPSNYPNLTTVSIPEDIIYCGITYSVTSIGVDAFYGCSSLTSITIPNSVTSIGKRAFGYCSSLTSITIPNSVTSIGDEAFDGCYSITSITIPNSVTSIGDEAFAGCYSIISIVVEDGNSVYDSRDNCNAIIKTATNKLIAGCQNTIIPNSVTSIGDYAFGYCRSLTSITIPNSVTSIGDEAFYYCSSLTSITIPNSVTSIGTRAFSGCSSLTSVTLPNSITSIGDYVFYNCSALTYPVYNANCFVYMPTSFEGDYTIPYGIYQIVGGAFGYCSSLTSITIPNSVTSIGGRAFRECSSLTSVTIGNSVTSIGNLAFYGCSSLTSVTIPNSVTSIGGSAFYNCSSLTSITCEAETPPTLGSSAFNRVSKSIPVYVPCGCVEAYKANSGWRYFTNIQEPLAEYSIIVSVNDTIMGNAAVVENTACGNMISATPNFGYHFVQWSDGNTENPRTLELTQYTILTAEFAQTFSGRCGDDLYWSYDETAKIISITGSGKMYDYTADAQPWLLFKEQIKEVTTSSTATSIGESAFAGAIRLGDVYLGSNMETIAKEAFAECSRLHHIYCYPTYPPFADQSSFANYNVYLHVPCDYQEEYDLDMVWGNFKYIECMGAEYEPVVPDTVIVTPGTTDVTITWPTDEKADSYSLVINKAGEPFCTLTFNADGQLLNIAFAPGRDGNHPAQYAEQAVNGYRFTVTGLKEGAHYTYNIDVRDAADKTIKSYTGEFTTESTTAVENTHSQSPTIDCQKILYEDHIYILRDGKTYTIMGAEIH